MKEINETTEIIMAMIMFIVVGCIVLFLVGVLMFVAAWLIVIGTPILAVLFLIRFAFTGKSL